MYVKKLFFGFDLQNAFFNILYKRRSHIQPVIKMAAKPVFVIPKNRPNNRLPKTVMLLCS